jgi:hypothetical protein
MESNISPFETTTSLVLNWPSANLTGWFVERFDNVGSTILKWKGAAQGEEI